MPRYLTKSRFKLGCECPAKLYYTRKAEYKDRSLEDTFLAALAQGGFQVGELAKIEHPGGHDVTTLNHAQALQETNALLELDQVTIFEAAVCYDNLFIRADVLVKDGQRIDLYEVKAKSVDSREDDPFTNAKGKITSVWQPYLYDVAFQKYVLTKAMPDHFIHAHLTLADKSVPCPVEGLNQLFRVRKDADGRFEVRVSEKAKDAPLDPSILAKINVDHEVQLIWNGTGGGPADTKPFDQLIQEMSDAYAADQKMGFKLTNKCRKCQFKARSTERAAGFKSGFHECWQAKLGIAEADLDQPLVLDVWNLHFTRTNRLISEQRVQLKQITEDDIEPQDGDGEGLTASGRQWLQVEKYQEQDSTDWLDVANMQAAVASWKWPLNMIDFETSMVAIPFHQGRRPYEQVAFQFSHHLLHEDGTVEHASEYLDTEIGSFPNYNFLRALKDALCQNEGSVFRFSHHENTVLNQIYWQLQKDPAPPEDADDLITFLQTISHSGNDSTTYWEGDRDMIDLCELVKRHWYDPGTGGSNSIKYVLPAMLRRSKWLQEKYSQPIYGASPGIPSLNFTDKQWLVIEGEHIVDPYQQLPPLFADLPEDVNELLCEEELNDGGGAMTAYARLQYEEMSDAERNAVRAGLLRYCELDTLAMVMLVEGWRDMIRGA